MSAGTSESGDATEPGGGGGGTGDGSEDQTGSGATGALTLDSLRAMLEERDAKYDQRIKRLNDEMARRRHNAKRNDDEDRSGDRTPAADRDEPISRAELSALREYDREIGRLSSLGFDVERIAEIEERLEAKTPQARVEYLRGLRDAAEQMRGSGTDETDASDRDDRRRVAETRKPTRGGEPPARPRQGPNHPESWEEYLRISKTDRKRFAELRNDETFDPQALRERSRAQHAAKFVSKGKR